MWYCETSFPRQGKIHAATLVVYSIGVKGLDVLWAGLSV